MGDASTNDRNKTWFVWGAVLTCSLSLPLFIALFNAFRGISQQKATGLGALAGGIVEGYVKLGLVLGLLLPIPQLFCSGGRCLGGMAFVRYFRCWASGGM